MTEVLAMEATKPAQFGWFIMTQLPTIIRSHLQVARLMMAFVGSPIFQPAVPQSPAFGQGPDYRAELQLTVRTGEP